MRREHPELDGRGDAHREHPPAAEAGGAAARRPRGRPRTEAEFVVVRGRQLRPARVARLLSQLASTDIERVAKRFRPDPIVESIIPVYKATPDPSVKRGGRPSANALSPLFQGNLPWLARLADLWVKAKLREEAERVELTSGRRPKIRASADERAQLKGRFLEAWRVGGEWKLPDAKSLVAFRKRMGVSALLIDCALLEAWLSVHDGQG